MQFIYHHILELRQQYLHYGASFRVYYGEPVEVWKNIIAEYNPVSAYTNHDYEPYAAFRDKQVCDLLNESGIAFHTYKDQVIFEKSEVTKDDGLPYTVFTPYSRKWKAKLTNFYLKEYPTESYVGNLIQSEVQPIPSLTEMNFDEATPIDYSYNVSESLLGNYDKTRNFPAMAGTSRISVHLRFGTVSIRKLAKLANETNETWLNELIWREFYMMILWHFPQVTTKAFKPAYDNIRWRNNESEFYAWCKGRTGYPIVDAGMRELNETGFMHNRVRMIVASFLTKHLLVDWRWGEAYFADKLLDFELSSNNGGWQWAASSGCDAAPYFRVFNPSEQTRKFDAEGNYIRKWVEDLNEFSYPKPIVEHAFARERVLRVYKEGLAIDN